MREKCTVSAVIYGKTSSRDSFTPLCAEHANKNEESLKALAECVVGGKAQVNKT
jgi:hypothetical protein